MAVKGIATGVVVVPILLLIVALALVNLDLTIRWEAKTTQEANIQATTYAMWNALKGAEMYMDLSTDYSVYQGCYDALRWGGFTEEGKNWSNNKDSSEVPPDEAIFKRNLETLIKRYMDRYTDDGYVFFEKYRVNSSEGDELPDIIIGDFELTMDKISFHAENEEDMQIKEQLISSFEEIDLRGDFSTDKEYEIPCLDIFMIGVTEHDIVQPLLEEMVKAEVDRWPKVNEKTYDPCGSDEDIIEEVRNEMFFEVAKELLIIDSTPSYKVYPSKDEAIEAAEERIAIYIGVDLSNEFMSRFRDSEYLIVPETEITVDIFPSCNRVGEDGTSCTYHCDIEYNTIAALRTRIMERERQYYPVAPSGLPEFDSMQLVITDRFVYK